MVWSLMWQKYFDPPCCFLGFYFELFSSFSSVSTTSFSRQIWQLNVHHLASDGQSDSCFLTRCLAAAEPKSTSPSPGRRLPDAPRAAGGSGGQPAVWLYGASSGQPRRRSAAGAPCPHPSPPSTRSQRSLTLAYFCGFTYTIHIECFFPFPYR